MRGYQRRLRLNDIPERTVIRDGDVLVPRSGNIFFATMVDGAPAGPGGERLFATSNVIIVRPSPHVDPYCLAALLNSPHGTEATLRGGPNRHTGVREIESLLLPVGFEDEGAVPRVAGWYRRALASRRATKMGYERARDALSKGLAGIGQVPDEALFDLSMPVGDRGSYRLVIDGRPIGSSVVTASSAEGGPLSFPASGAEMAEAIVSLACLEGATVRRERDGCVTVDVSTSTTEE